METLIPLPFGRFRPAPVQAAQPGLGGWLRSFFFSLLTAAGLLACAFGAFAADHYPPGKLTFQGHVSDANGVPLGSAGPVNALVEFRLYRSATGTAPSDLLWAERQSLKVSQGFFTALLGGGSPTGLSGEFHTNNLAGLFLGPDASQRYLGVTVVGEGSEITPRIQFFSTPFAYLARATATLLNESGESIVQTAPGAVGVNLEGSAPGAELDVNGVVKAARLIGDGSGLTGVAVAAGSITGTFDSTRIADGTITGDKFAPGTIQTSHLAPDAVVANKLSPDAASAIAGRAGGIGTGGVIVSSKKIDSVLHNMGYVNIGRASFEGPSWNIRATKNTPNAPMPRVNRFGSTDHRQSATLWTGAKWILWSGRNISDNGYVSDGAAFDPALNSWTPISTTDAPVARDEVNFLWTGTKGLVWGGHNGSWLAHGGIYDPASDTWSSMSTVNQPSGRTRQRNVWTGEEMFVWGGEINGSTVLNDGKLYNPATDTWREMAVAPVSGRRDFNAVWTGSEVLVWGGERPGSYLSDGALYNPATDTWRMMSGLNAPSAREMGMGVWTGQEWIVWGGFNGSYALTDGGRYDLAADTWIPFSTPNYHGFHEGAAFWSGSKAYFLQGRSTGGLVNEFSGGYMSGLSFDPSKNTWAYLARAPITQAWMPHAWTGSELLTFATYVDGGDRTVLSFKSESESYFYAKRSSTLDKWEIRATKETANAPMPRISQFTSSNPRTVWTGTKWLVWGEMTLPAEAGVSLNSGAMFDPANNSWQPISSVNAPSARSQFSVVWTGSQAIYWGGYTNNYIGNGKSYDPAADSWSDISATAAPTARARHTAVWTGTEMIVWGGANNTPQKTANDGARYNAATENWTALAASPLAERADHIAVWTGTEMLVWGGSTSSDIKQGALGDGARYNPVSDTWQMMSAENAPISRALPLAVWTGTEMIIWGGYVGLASANSGGRYNPATDTWTAFNTGSHTWSQECAAVWTGSMVIYAGGVDATGLVNHSGKGGITYDPATGELGVLPVAPISQRNMPYAWTGTELLTFGSWEDFTDRTVLSYRPKP